MPRWWILGGLVVATWLFGPWIPVLALASLAHPRVREVVRPARPWRGLGILAAVGLVLAAVVVVVPDAWLPLPPGAGTLMAPSYVGRAAIEHKIPGPSVPQHPGLARAGTGWPGPTGDRPEVTTAWYGLERCRSLAVDSDHGLVGLCGSPGAPSLRRIDARSLRSTDSLELPARGDTECDSSFFLDDRDRAIVATTDRRVLTVDAADGFRIDSSIDLTDTVPAGDCLVALAPSWGRPGRVWFATDGGLVGLTGRGGPTATLDLGARIAHSLVVDQHGAYVVTVDALYGLSVDRRGRPVVDWVRPYDHGATPTVLPGDLVAAVDNEEPRARVVFLRRSTGEELCAAPVFDSGDSAVDDGPVAVGPSGVVVANSAGYSGVTSTLLGRTTSGGLARVDLADGRCMVRWTADVDAPSASPRVSWRTGLVYALAKRSSLAGVSAWYLSAVDPDTGHVVFAVRVGLGFLAGHDEAPVTLTPDGSAYAATRGGLVRVRDR